ILFNQLVEFLFSALKGQDMFRRPFQNHNRKHLAGDLENKVVAPLHILSRVRKREAIGAHRFTIQLLYYVYEESGERKRRPLFEWLRSIPSVARTIAVGLTANFAQSFDDPITRSNRSRCSGADA